MPCDFQISVGEKTSLSSSDNLEESCYSSFIGMNNLNIIVGEKVNYKWECNSGKIENFRFYFFNNFFHPLTYPTKIYIYFNIQFF